MYETFLNLEIKIMSRKLFVSLEDGDVNPGIEVGATTGDAELESQIADVSDAGGEVHEMVAAVEDGVDEIENLEDVGDVVERTTEDGAEGVSPEAAEIAEIAVERARYKLGLRATRVMPSTEAFGSRQSRLSATKIGTEGIWDTIKEAWAKIKAMFVAMWKKIVDFCAKVFTGAGRLKGRAAALAKKAATGGNEKKEEEFKNDSIVNAFAVGGSFTEANVLTILANHSEAVKDVNGLIDSGSKAIKEVATYVEKASKGKDLSGVKVEMMAKFKAQAGSIKFAQDGTELAKQSGHDGQVTAAVATKQLVDNKAILFVMESVGSGDDNVSVVSLDVVDYTKQEESLKDVDVKVADRNAMVQIAKRVESLADELMKFSTQQKQSKEIGGAVNDIFNKVEAAISKFAGSKNEAEAAEAKEAAATVNEARKVVTSVGKAASSGTIHLQTLSLKAGNSALNYVQASLSNYKG